MTVDLSNAANNDAGIYLDRHSLSNIEGLIGSAGDDSLVGSDTVASVLSGGAGADTLVAASAGADTLDGGAGDDIYVINSADDVLSDSGATTGDLARAGLSFTLAGGVENLELTGAGDIDGTGDGTANLITGNGGDNVLSSAMGPTRYAAAPPT